MIETQAISRIETIGTNLGKYLLGRTVVSFMYTKVLDPYILIIIPSFLRDIPRQTVQYMNVPHLNA